MKRVLSFTLIELLVVIIILAILAAVAIPVYRNRVDQIQIDICAAHQEALLEAIKIYDMKYDSMPGSLAKVWRKNGDKALAIVWQKKKKERDYIYLAYISFQKFKFQIVDFFSLNTLNAQPAFSTTLADRSILKCPADTNELPSYGINSDISEYERWDNIPVDPVDPMDPVDTIVIADSDTPTFSAADQGNLPSRHRGGVIIAYRSSRIMLIGAAGGPQELLAGVGD